MLSACPPLESERAAWRRAPEQTAAPPSSYLASLFRRAPSRPTAKVSPMSLDQTVTHVIRLSQARALPNQKKSARGRQIEELVKIPRAVDVHDTALQLLALILADYISAKRGKFHRDFIFCHWIARIAFRDIDPR